MPPALTALQEPSDEDRREARDASRALSRLSGHDRVHVEAVAENEPRQAFILPAPAVRLLTDILAHLAEGKVVTVVPNDATLTTQQAADMLNVSRPYLIGLLEAGDIPFRMTGTHRRILFGDLRAYRERSAELRRNALMELVAEGEMLGLDD